MALWLIWIGGLSLIWFPGVLLHRLLRLPASPDWLIVLATQLGLGLAFWPVLLLWTTQIGWHWTPRAAQIVAGVLVLAGVVALSWMPGCWAQRAAQIRRQGFWLTLIGCIVALTVVTRILQVRGLALPVWVDPVHHVAIVRLLLAQGAVPATFDPFIPGGVFNYHWGFHAVATWVAWLLGVSDAFSVADIVLHLGQVLNVLAVVMFYAAGRVLFASRRAGLLTAVIVGLVSWFPAYFLSWGRYTHLTGVLLMAPALILLWQLRSRIHAGAVVAAALVIGGLALVHVRVAVLTAIFAGLLTMLLLIQGRWRTVLWWLAAATCALLLTLPWWLWLWQSAWVRAMVAVRPDASAAWTTYNLPDWGLVWAPRNLQLAALGSAGISALLGWQQVDLFVQMAGAFWLALLVGAAIWAWRRPALRQPTGRTWQGWALLVAWVAGAAFLLQANRLGLPSVRFIHVNAGIITLFAPLGLAVGGLVAWLLGLVAPSRFAQYVAGVAALAIAFWGASGMTTMVNPTTILATPADRAALIWVRANVPAEARFAVNTWEWLGGVYAGSDGGYWLSVLADRASILPPAQYAAALPQATVQQMNERFARLAAATNLDDPALRAELAAQGVSYLYLGVREGPLRAEQIDGKPYAMLIYRQDGVSIYALQLD